MIVAQQFTAGITSGRISSPRSGRLHDKGQIPLTLFSRPLHGLGLIFLVNPSDESLGYFQSSADADSEALLLVQSNLKRELKSS